MHDLIVSSMTFFITNNIPQIPGDDIAKKWDLCQFKEKKEEDKKFSQLFALSII